MYSIHVTCTPELQFRKTKLESRVKGFVIQSAEMTACIHNTEHYPEFDDLLQDRNVQAGECMQNLKILLKTAEQEIFEVLLKDYFQKHYSRILYGIKYF